MPHGPVSPDVLRIPTKALLFDCDGVLVDSVAAGERGWAQWATEHGLDPADVLPAIHGRRSTETARHFLPDRDDAGIAAAVARIDAIETADAVHTRPIPGAAALLAGLGERPWAVVTSATTVLATARLGGAALPLPDVLVSGDTVATGKPAPDCYLAAAARLGLAPAHTTVFEDTAAGIRAARAAGAGHVVGIGKRALDSDADIVVPDLACLAWDGTTLTVRADALLRGPADPDLLFLPTHLRNVPYVYARDPGRTTPGDVSEGANCQVYAYAVLAHFGRRVPPLRSSDLWADETAVTTVTDPRPLDLLLYDAGPLPGRPDGYAAHVAVHLAADRILHLCKEAARPAVWTPADFAARPRYTRLLGAKRAPAE
ncbi:HAD-IA family hydrolase [Uniformispora flossi]|uniref:HAD-IA family hydrolase n=1 Tax=Uniformispora flossi TaxID=3390723 RepID=UPI003C2CE8E5